MARIEAVQEARSHTWKFVDSAMDKVFVGSGKVIDLDLSNFDANRMGRQVADALKADTRHHVPAREEIIGLDWSRGLKRPLDKFHDALSAALDVFTGEASVWASLEMMRQGIEEGSMKRKMVEARDRIDIAVSALERDMLMKVIRSGLDILEKKVEERKRELIGLRRAGAGDTEAVTLLKELIVPLQRFRDSVDGTIQTVERL